MFLTLKEHWFSIVGYTGTFLGLIVIGLDSLPFFPIPFNIPFNECKVMQSIYIK